MSDKPVSAYVVGCPNCKREFDPRESVPSRCPQCGFVNHPVRMSREEWDRLEGFGEQPDADEPYFGM